MKDDFVHKVLAHITSSDIAAFRDKRLKTITGSSVNRELSIISDCIKKDVNLDLKLMVNNFNQMRKKETKNILRFTDSLVTLFSNDFVGVNKIRGMALSFLDLIPPVKKRFLKKGGKFKKMNIKDIKFEEEKPILIADNEKFFVICY